MALNELVGVRDHGFGGMMSFSVVVTGGTGAFTFPVAVTGKVYHRQVLPPGGSGVFTFYFQNGFGIAHDIHTITGPTDIDDAGLLVNETSFVIVNAVTDGTYNVALWVGSL